MRDGGEDVTGMLHQALKRTRSLELNNLSSLECSDEVEVSRVTFADRNRSLEVGSYATHRYLAHSLHPLTLRSVHYDFRTQTEVPFQVHLYFRGAVMKVLRDQSWPVAIKLREARRALKSDRNRRVFCLWK